MLHRLQSTLRDRWFAPICNSSSSRMDKAVHRVKELPIYTLTVGLCPGTLLILGHKSGGALHSVSQFHVSSPSAEFAPVTRGKAMILQKSKEYLGHLIVLFHGFLLLLFGLTQNFPLLYTLCHLTLVSACNELANVTGLQCQYAQVLALSDSLQPANGVFMRQDLSAVSGHHRQGSGSWWQVPVSSGQLPTGSMVQAQVQVQGAVQ